jgi:hypothetical protein
MTDVENKVSISTKITIPFIILDNNSFNHYSDYNDKGEPLGTTDLTISVKPLTDITPGVGATNQISQWTILTIKSETIENLIVKFFKADETTTSGQPDITLRYGTTNNQTILLTLNGDGRYTATLLNGNKFNALGVGEIKKLANEVLSNIDPNLNAGMDAAARKTFKIRPSGWLCSSLGVIDDGVAAGRPLAIDINIELNSNDQSKTKFNEELLIYPYKTGTIEEDTTKAPLAWSLFQQKTGLGAMPLVPGENKFKDYTNLTANKPDLPVSKNDTNDYLIGGRFNGANTIATTAAKDKMSVHSQGSMLLHIVFSVVTPRTIYFKINNQYAPFIKILFYSFQIQSFYNGVLKYFYAPLYKNVVFQQNSFDEKGLFISAPTVAGAAKKTPIQNIYQWSKISTTGNLANRFGEDGSENLITEEDCYYAEECDDEGDVAGSQKTNEPFIGPRDCDFRYFTDASVFPAAGTMPLLKSVDKAFFTTPEPLRENKDSRNDKPAFVMLKKIDTDKNDSLFEVIDKETVDITPVVDMNFNMTTTATAPFKNVEKVALTINNNMILFIGKTFIKKITDGKYKAFDIIFNQKQYWLTIVFEKVALDDKTIASLKTFFPQFGASTTASQKIISDGIDTLKEGLKTGDMSMTFKLKATTATDKVAAVKPTAITAPEFEVKALDAELKTKLISTGIAFE